MADEPAAPAVPQQRGRPFAPGQSGNPAGRTKGSFNRSTMLAQALLGREAGAIARRLIEAAKDKLDPAHSVALRLAAERLMPVMRAGSIRIDLPLIKTLEDVPLALREVIAAVTSGVISLDDGERLAALVDRQRIALEAPDLELRLRELEHQYREMARAQMGSSPAVARWNGRGV